MRYGEFIKAIKDVPPAPEVSLNISKNRSNWFRAAIAATLIISSITLSLRRGSVDSDLYLSSAEIEIEHIYEYFFGEEEEYLLTGIFFDQ